MADRGMASGLRFAGGRRGHSCSDHLGAHRSLIGTACCFVRTAITSRDVSIAAAILPGRRCCRKQLKRWRTRANSSIAHLVTMGGGCDRIVSILPCREPESWRVSGDRVLRRGHTRREKWACR
jgi:hypothetical protein